MTYKVTNFLIDKTVQQHSLRSKDTADYYPNLIKKNIMYYLYRKSFKIRKELGSQVRLKPKHYPESGKITKDNLNMIFLNKTKTIKTPYEIMDELLKIKSNREIFKKLIQ